MNANIDISNVTLKTNRVILRPWRYTDIDDFFEYASVPGVGESAGWEHHKTKENSKTILDMFIKEKKTFAIEYNGKVIGSLGIEKYNENLVPELDDKSGREIGFVLSKEHWGKGLMPETVRAVTDWLLYDVCLDFVLCRHSSDNIRSKRVQEKCGFKPYKVSKYKTEYGEIKEDCVNIMYRETE